MIFSKNLIGIFLIFLGNCLCSKPIDEPTLIDQLRWDWLTIETELWTDIRNETDLVRKLYDFDQQLQKLPHDILQYGKVLEGIPNFLYLYPELLNIDNIYEKFREYQNGYLLRKDDQILIESVTYDITNNRSGTTETIKKIYEYSGIYGGSTDTVIEQLEKVLAENFGCKKIKQSPQQVMYNVYNILAVRDLKAYIMEQFIYLIYRFYNKENNIEIANIARRKYKARTNALIKRIDLKFPNDIWKCDPKEHVLGKTYDQFTRLIQGHVQNEVDMNSRGTCRKTCDDYSYTASKGCYDSKSDYCRKMETCKGKIIGCFYIERKSTVCPSQSRTRRYDYIKFNSGLTYGKWRHCPKAMNVYSWIRWFVRCAYCMCLCDESGPLSDRYVSLRPVLADIEHNRVVTGIRLVKHHRILHLQIQQGKLLSHGYIDQSTVHWVPVDDYKITTPGVREGTDFKLMDFAHRTMALDELHIHEPNHIITGVRFEYINDKIYFEIHISRFDWNNGTVSQTNGYFVYGATNDYSRANINLDNVDIPILTQQPSVKHQSGEHQVQFTHSSFQKDAAQTTVPFIDIQEVTNEPAVPLSGAGIVYKGQPRYGGFITPTIKTYDFSKHISNNMPQSPEEYFDDVMIN